MADSAPSRGTLEVRAKGFSAREWQVQKAVLIFGPVDFLFIVFGTIGGVGSDTTAKVALALGTVVFADLLLLELVSFPRRVTMSSTGVTFRFRFHRQRRSWNELLPTLTPLHAWKDGSWAVEYISRGRLTRGKRFGYCLTSDQARGLVSYPSGKEWSMSPELTQLLGTSAG
jgi:hypothetical protein